MAWNQLYSELAKEEKKLYSFYLLIIRLYWGWQLVLIGAGKFADLNGIAQFFASLGIIWPHFFAPIVGFFELLGGITMLIGLGVRLTMIPVITILITALATAHRAAGSQFISDPAVLVTQLPMTFLLTALAILIGGSGKFSFDYLIEKKLHRNHHNKKPTRL